MHLVHYFLRGQQLWSRISARGSEAIPYLTFNQHVETVSTWRSHPSADPVSSRVAPHSWVENWPLLPRRVHGLPSIQAVMWQSCSCPVFGRVFPVIYSRLALLPKVSCKAHQEWNALYPHARHSRVSPHYQRCWLDQNNQFYFRGVFGMHSPWSKLRKFMDISSKKKKKKLSTTDG